MELVDLRELKKIHKGSLVSLKEKNSKDKMWGLAGPQSSQQVAPSTLSWSLDPARRGTCTSMPGPLREQF